MVRQCVLAATVSMFLTVAPVAAARTSATAGVTQAPIPGLDVPPVGMTQELVLQDGSRMYGRVERIDGSTFVFRTTAGVAVNADIAQVRSIRVVSGRVLNGLFRHDDPNPTRLFFGPTGRSLPKGAGYVGVYEVFMPFVQVGITDRISIGGGTPLFFGEGSEHPFWITPKVQVLALPNTQASVGVMHFMNVGDGNFGVAYGAVTQGTVDTAVTVGLGYAYERSSGDVDGVAVWMIGGEHRVSRRIKLLTESYLVGGEGLGSFGVRFIGERLTADLGLVLPLGMNERFVFPVANFVWRF